MIRFFLFSFVFECVFYDLEGAPRLVLEGARVKGTPPMASEGAPYLVYKEGPCKGGQVILHKRPFFDDQKNRRKK